MRVLAITTVKNEGAFLIDWLAWHRWLGFTDFLVFSNDCTDGTDRMLDRLQAMGWLRHLPNPGPWKEGPQWAALKRAATDPLTVGADWVMVLDVDEYLTIHTGGGQIADLIAARPDANGFALTWRVFGNGGAVAFEDRPVPLRFTRAAPRVMGWPWRAAMIKTLYRNDGTWGKPGVHRPRSPDPERLDAVRWVDGSGRELPASFVRGRVFSDYGQDNYALAQVCHYPLGSMQDFALKSARGRANRDAEMFDLSYFVERNLCQDSDLSLANRFPACAPMRAELRADPALAALHQEAAGWRRTRFAELMADDRWRSFFGQMLMAGPSRPLDGAETAFMARAFRGEPLGPLPPDRPYS